TLRSRTPRYIYIAMLIQAMYYVPHIRTAFSRIVSDHRDMENLQPFWEAMARMEMGVQRDIHLDDLLQEHLTSENDENAMVKDIKETVAEFYSQFATEMSGPSHAFPSSLLISQIWQPPSLARSSFSSNTSMWVDERSLAETGITQDYPLIPITSNINSEENSLLSYLHELTWFRKLQVAADVLVFSISHEEGPPTPSIYRSTPTTSSTNGKGTSSGGTSNTAGKLNNSAPSQKYPLQFPAQLYVDPFMLDNLDIAKIQKESQIKMETSVRDIEKKISALGGGTNKLPIKNLQMSIKYYQEIIANEGTQEQKDLNKATLEALEAVLDRVEKEIEEKKDELSRTKKEITELYELTALKKMPYELCAVLMWDGVYGRTHVYSYVKAKDGNWYKIVDSSATQVTEETVLNDSSGLHLTAGPFMLFYSSLENSTSFDTISQEAAQEGLTRPLSKETRSLLQKQFSEWSKEVREIVRRANSEFRTQLGNEQLVDEDGRLVKRSEDSGSDSPTKTLWPDPLHFLHIIDEEKEMVYDSDPEEMNMEDITGSQSHEAASSRRNSSKGLWDLTTNNETVKDDTGPGWVPQGDPNMTWEEALTKESPKQTNWDGWGSQNATGGNKIEVQVTRTVETNSTEVGGTQSTSPST
ncbi:3666_t:CDS:2, partial [Acaulospora colombiana]